MKKIALIWLVAAAACRAGVNGGGGVRMDPAQAELFGQLPGSMPVMEHPATPARVVLGRMLYYETRLSVDSSVSCNSCHLLGAYGVDNRPVSLGVKGQPGSRNSPSVYNAAGHLAQFWDGRAPTVEEQAKGPILNPVEMGMPSGDAVTERIKALAEYRAAFAAAFPGEADPVTYDNVGRAIGAFERGLVTPSRWDAFLAGDAAALTPAEKSGLATFLSLGCATCHRGTYIGGGMYQKAGLVEPWPEQDDLGRYAVTHRRGDQLVFKVPSLRNIERTAPYFHNGQVATLEEAVRRMARYQLGRELSEAEVASVVTWLKSLTGTISRDYVAPPALPAPGISAVMSHPQRSAASTSGRGRRPQ
jgi:cytochrome c peroxidase